MRGIGGRLVRALVAFALIALTAGAFVPTAQAQTETDPYSIVAYNSKCSNISEVGSWGRIALPTFGSGDARVQSYTVDSWNKKRLFVTNGNEVYRSMDGGCSWKLVYSLPATPSPQNDYSVVDSRIEQVVIPEGTTADKIVYFTVDQFRPPQGIKRGERTRVFRSFNNGERWGEANGQLPDVLPPRGAPESLVPSPSFPKVLYLLLESPEVQYTATSPDGGETWETTGPFCIGPALPNQIENPVQELPTLPGPGCIDPDQGTTNAPKPGDTVGIAIDPFHPNDLWYYGPRGLERSMNNGKSPKTISAVEEPIADVDIFRSAGVESRIVAGSATAPALHISEDGGKTWRVDNAPGFVESFAKGRRASEYAMSVDSGVFFRTGDQDISITPKGMPIKNLQSARQLGGKPGLCFFGDNGGGIAVTCLRPPDIHCLPGDPRCPPPPPEIDINPGDYIPTRAANFSPEGYETTLERGESESVPYTLQMFKSPTPLDVYFLIDISGSMQNTIDGVAHGMQNIINELTDKKIDTHFGVGVYRAYDDPPAYKRVWDIAPPSEGLERALESLIANGGGEETQLAALRQAAKGDGQTAIVPVTLAQTEIKPGQQANFRDEALKVIIHATDEKFSTLPPHPSFDSVITALNEEGIEQVGLAIQEPSTGGSADDPDLAQTSPRSGLLRVAEGTHTAAVGPVDCDGNGTTDIAPNDPLVCDIDPDKAYKSSLMSGAIVQLLESVEDFGEVTITVDAPPGVVPNIEQQIFTGVDFKHPPPLPFDVMFTCPSNTTDTEFEVKFNAYASQFMIAETMATVRCTIPKKPKPPEVPPKPELDEPELDEPELFFPPIPFFPPIVRPPEVTPNPGPNTQAQTQSQSQAQAQSAMAKQKQEQVQLALAYSKSVKAELAAERAGEQLNMSKYRPTSSRRREELPPGVLLMMSASAMSLAFGLASKKFKPQYSSARRNRRPRY